jgi:hypothetical protein
MLAVAGVLPAACAPSKLTPLSLAPQYRTMAESVEIPVVQPCVGFSGLTVEDARAAKDTGVRVIEERPGTSQPVSFPGDPVPWVRAAAEAVFRQAGVRTDVAGKPALKLRVEQIVTDEKVYRRAEYDGRVVLTAELLSGEGGASCWTGRVDGFSENYGYAGSLENYEETLNHALDRAIIKLLETPDLGAKACGGC